MAWFQAGFSFEAAGRAAFHAVPAGPDLARVCGCWDAGLGCTSDGTLQSWGRTRAAEDLQGVRGIAAGFSHALTVTEVGQIYELEAGHCLSGTLVEFTNRWRQRALADEARATSVAAGEKHSAALDEKGRVWTWGANGEGQLGHNYAGDEPRCLNIGTSQVRQVACGGRHTSALTSDGSLYLWGWSSYGQCGGETACSVPRPTLMAALGGLRVVCVAAGLGHTVACTDAGAVFAWGWNSDGQLGTGTRQASSTPEMVASPLLEPAHVVKVSCGARHTLALAADGRVFGWGWNKYWQLGQSSQLEVLDPMTLRPCLGGEARAQDIACGWWQSYIRLR